MKAKLVVRRRLVFDIADLAEFVVWQVPVLVPPSAHFFKYRLVYIVGGVRVLGFDNEHGKGDHRHDDGLETSYSFRGVDRLLQDFVETVEVWRKAHEKTEIQVGRSLRDAAADVAAAWKAAEAGHPEAVSDRIYFQDWAALCAVLTPKRCELLRHLRQSPASGVRALARQLGRDVKRVHQDIVALADLGLVARDEDGGLSSPFDEIASTIHIAA